MYKIMDRFILNPLRSAVNVLAGSRIFSFLIIFVLAFSIRANELAKIPARYLIPNASRELGAIAISLVKTGQFANPYMIPTGPTAHLPPIYPAIFALIYKIYGLTSTAGYATMYFLILTGSLLYALLPWFSSKLGTGRQTGFIAGIAGAFLVEWPGHGEYPTAIALGLILVVFVKHWKADKIPWLSPFLLGLGSGVAFHLQPALLPVVLGCMVFGLWLKRSKQQLAQVGVLVVGIIIACLPWGWRNYKTFDSVFFIRNNFWLEIRMGNHDEAAPAMEVMDATVEHRHPGGYFPDARIVRDQGEIEYQRQVKEEVIAWLNANPSKFMSLTLQRIAHFWFGPLHRPQDALLVSLLTVLAFLGIWHVFPDLSVPQRGALLIPLITFPVIYYLVPYMPRYRVPIDWILYTLASAAVWKLINLPKLNFELKVNNHLDTQ